MIKTKNKILSFVLFGMLAVSLSLCFVFASPVKTYAAAITTPKYSMEFNYSISTTTGTGGGTGSSTATGKGYSVSVQTAQYSSTTASLSIYGSGSSGTGTFPIGSYINSSIVNLAITSGINQGSITVTNSSGTQVGKGGKSLYLGDLADGTYNVALFFGSGAWATSARSGVGKSTSGSTSFIVDCTAPSISGASTSTTGKYTNQAFTVSASDSGSGVASLYMMSPTASSYSACGTSTTVSSGSVNGLYRFYATDNAGNTSSTYYVYYDTSKPTLSVKTSSGTAITQYTNQAFYCTASDVGSGVYSMDYKTPNSTVWSVYTPGVSIPATSTNGCYQFRATDKAGNVSDSVLVYFDTVNPTGTLYGGSSIISSGGATNAQYVMFLPSDSYSGVKNIYVKTPSSSSYTTYSSGSQLATNGTYYFYCTDNAGNSSATYSIKLDNVAPTMTCSQTDFYSTVDNDFTIKVSDSLSSVTLYYKTPLMSSYASTTSSSYSITTLDSDGKYYFYAVDSVGNKTETKWIELKVAAPVATVERDKDTNQYRVVWDGTATGRLNNAPYEKGTWISDEGEYTFVITNSSNRSSTYSFTIAHCFWVYVTIDPTCTEQGYTVYRCITCGYTYYADYVEAKGHDYEQKLIGESCTEGAYYLYTCKDCGHEEKSEYLTSGGHKYDKTIVPPNCTDRGYTTYKCSVCGYTFNDDYVAAKGHNYKATVLKPTCTEMGYTTFSCKVCHDEYISDYTVALGHDYQTETIEATCTEKGCTLHKCSRCKDEYKTDETMALGHYYTERTIEVSCEENGCVLHTCTRCGYEYETNVVKALGHKYVSEVQEMATCTEDGHRHHLCARCGNSYVTDIPAFGHNYEITDIRTKGGETERTYQCSICGHTYVQELGDQYEEVSNYVEYLFQQYSPYMIYVFLATAGVWSIGMGIAMIIAKKNEEKEKAKKMLVNYCIGLVVIFVILIAAPYLVRGIAALISG